MASSNAPGANVLSDADHAAHQAANSPWVVYLARFGYAAKGIVYLIIGFLALAAAIGRGGTTTDRSGAAQTIYQQPFGRFLLIVVAVGWLGYALWNWILAALDADHEGTGAKGIARRIGYAVVGVSYGGLAVAAIQMAVGRGAGGKSSDAQAQDWTARLLGHGWGVALVVLAGAVMLVVAGFIYSYAYSARFRERLDLYRAPGGSAGWVLWLGRLGYGALGVIFTVIGFFLIVAALRHNPGEAKGLGGALQALAQQPFGQVLLFVVAAGLVAYGLYSLIQAVYRRIGPA